MAKGRSELNPSEILKSYAAIKKHLEEQAEWYRSINDLEGEKARLSEINSERQRAINELLSIDIEKRKGVEKELEKLIADQKEAINNEKNTNTELQKQVSVRRRLVDIGKEVSNQLKNGWTYLQAQDKTIKNTVLNLGLSGTKAELMRTSFEQSAGFVSRLGGNLEDIQAIMQGYADETGKARALSANMVEDITLIGKGTGLGIEQATRLASQFEFMGINTKETMDYVQGVVDTSERMGVNTTKVLKNINDNFKKLSTFTFQKGVKAYADMAQSAEKTRVSMSTALDVAEATRGLEQVIELGANLQVMGGAFAEMDPFQWLYISRNEPEKMTEKISEMTKGVFTFKKNSEGVMEKFISPADRDRLAGVAKSLGITKEEMFEIAQKRLDMDTMAKQLEGTGLTGREKELIEGAAVFNKETGKYQVKLAGQMKDIGSLTKDQVKSFAQEQKTLKARAEEAQTFEEVFKATINELKATLLPLLKTINGFLVKIRPIVDGVVKFLTGDKIIPGWMKVIGAFTAATLLWKGANSIFSKGVDRFVEGGMSKIFGGAGKSGGAPSAGGGAGGAGAGGGGKAFGAGAGIGAAAVGIGAGIAVAAVGISKLADSMSKLTPEQAKTLSDIVKTLTVFMGVSVGLVAAIVLFGGAAAGTAGPLLAFGAAIALIGVGIGVAALGIGEMAKGLAVLVTAGKDAGDSMLTMGVGMAAMAASMMLFTAGGLGMLVFAGVMKTISKNAEGVAKVGEAFKQINAALSGNKEDYAAIAASINSIANANVKGGGVISELSKMLKSPLKVEFSDKQVAVVSNITLNIDGEKFHEKTKTGAYVVQSNSESKAGLGGKK